MMRKPPVSVRTAPRYQPSMGDSKATQKQPAPQPPPKLAKHDDATTEEDGYEEQLEAIEIIQNELDALTDRASEEILRVEQKYNDLRKPEFVRRAEAIAKIPEFWFTALLNHPALADHISDQDEQVLRWLKNIHVQEFEEIKSGYNISFEFASNPFFENGTLSKEYKLDEEGEPVSVSTPIRWKPGKNLTDAGGSEKGRKRPRDTRKSFFHWFTDVQDEGADQIAEAIKDDLWSSPLHFFLGQIELPEEDIDEEDADQYATESGDDDDVREVVVIGGDDDLEEEEEEEEEEEDGGRSGRDPVAETEGEVYEVEELLDDEEEEEEEEEEAQEYEEEDESLLEGEEPDGKKGSGTEVQG